MSLAQVSNIYSNLSEPRVGLGHVVTAMEGAGFEVTGKEMYRLGDPMGSAGEKPEPVTLSQHKHEMQVRQAQEREERDDLVRQAERAHWEEEIEKAVTSEGFVPQPTLGRDALGMIRQLAENAAQKAVDLIRRDREERDKGIAVGAEKEMERWEREIKDAGQLVGFDVRGLVGMAIVRELASEWKAMKLQELAAPPIHITAVGERKRIRHDVGALARAANETGDRVTGANQEITKLQAIVLSHEERIARVELVDQEEAPDAPGSEEAG